MKDFRDMSVGEIVALVISAIKAGSNDAYRKEIQVMSKNLLIHMNNESHLYFGRNNIVPMVALLETWEQLAFNFLAFQPREDVSWVTDNEIISQFQKMLMIYHERMNKLRDPAIIQNIRDQKEKVKSP